MAAVGPNFCEMKIELDYIALRDSIAEEGIELIKNSSKEEEPAWKFYNGIIAIHNKFKPIDDMTERSIWDAFRRIIRYKSCPDKPPDAIDFLARICDNNLRWPPKMTPERYKNHAWFMKYLISRLDCPEVFFTRYRTLMNERLILGKHTQEQIEREKWLLEQISKGNMISHELFELLADHEAAWKLDEAFKQHEHPQDPDATGQYQVLRRSLWPISEMADNSKIKLPAELQRVHNSFEKYFYSKYENRKLTWLHNNCLVDVSLYYTPGKEEIVVMRAYHLFILMLFESTDELTYHQISVATKLSKLNLDAHLEELVNIKVLLIATDPSEPDSDYQHELPKQAEDDDDDHPRCERESPFAPSTKIRLNFDFKSDEEAVFMPGPRLRLAEVRRTSEVGARNPSQKKLCIQAAIVRIMKSRKVLSRDELVDNVMTLTKDKFPVGGPMIRECIAILMAKEYLKRSAKMPDAFEYIP